jgi:hypothetical protein
MLNSYIAHPEILYSFELDIRISYLPT